MHQCSRLLHRRQVDVDEEHVGALLGEQECRLEADAAVHRKVDDIGGFECVNGDRDGAMTYDPAPVMRADYESVD